jgi:cobalt-zinc-cadmium resistance protein CzcA
MPPSVSDTFIILKPRAIGPDPRSLEDVRRVSKNGSRTSRANYEFLQPIQMRFNELIAGAQRPGYQAIR